MGVSRRAGLAMFVIGWLAAGSAVAGETAARITVAFDGFSMTSAPMYYADKKGIFGKFGIETKPTFIDGGSTLSHAVVGGSIDIAQNGYTPAITAAVQGADIVVIGGISNKLPYQLVVRAAFSEPQQLKGAKIAISRFGSSTDTAVEFALAHVGLKRSDVNILQLGGAATRMAAAMSGQIDGTVEQYPVTEELMEHGYRVLVDLTDIAGDYPNTAYVTTRAYLKAHPDLVKRFFMVMATAVHAYKTDREEAILLTQEFLGVKNSVAATAAYEAYTQKVYPDDLRPSLNGIALVLKDLERHVPAAASVKPEQLVDTSALDALHRDGFFTALARGN